MNYSQAIKQTLTEFLRDLEVISTSDERGELSVIKFFFSKMDEVSISDHIVRYVLPYSKKIKAKNIDFFLSNSNDIFSGLPQNKVSYFSQKMSMNEASGGMSDENKDIVWDYFNILVQLGEGYKKGV